MKKWDHAVILLIHANPCKLIFMPMMNTATTPGDTDKLTKRRTVRPWIGSVHQPYALARLGQRGLISTIPSSKERILLAHVKQLAWKVMKLIFSIGLKWHRKTSATTMGETNKRSRILVKSWEEAKRHHNPQQYHGEDEESLGKNRTFIIFIGRFLFFPSVQPRGQIRQSEKMREPGNDQLQLVDILVFKFPEHFLVFREIIISSRKRPFMHCRNLPRT